MAAAPLAAPAPVVAAVPTVAAAPAAAPSPVDAPAPLDPGLAGIDASAVPSADQAWSAFSETGLGADEGLDPLDAPEPTTLRRTFTYDSAPTRRGGA